MTAHSRRYAPSSFSRRILCPASANIEEALPDTTTDFAEEGTAAHELAAACLTSRVDTDLHQGSFFNGYEVTAEMAECVQQYVDYVRNIAAGHALLVERRVNFTHLAPDGFGTADAIAINSFERTMFVVDLKYGKGVRVDAKNNVQAVLYALGAINTYDLVIGDAVDKITIAIHQPRLDHISEWSLSIDELKAFESVVVETVAKCEADNPLFGPGEDQCRFCKAKATCKARADHLTAIATRGETCNFEDFSSEKLTKPNLLADKDVAALLPHLDDMAHWVKDLKEHATAALENGRDVPGYKLVAGRSVRKWADADLVEKTLKRMRMRKADMYEQKLISPTQAQKKLGGKFEKLQCLVVKPDGKPTLAPVDDKRPAITFTFENLDKENAK